MMLAVGFLCATILFAMGIYLFIHADDLVLRRQVLGSEAELGMKRLHEMLVFGQVLAGFTALTSVYVAKRLCDKWQNPADREPLIR